MDKTFWPHRLEAITEINLNTYFLSCSKDRRWRGMYPFHMAHFCHICILCARVCCFARWNTCTLVLGRAGAVAPWRLWNPADVSHTQIHLNVGRDDIHIWKLRNVQRTQLSEFTSARGLHSIRILYLAHMYGLRRLQPFFQAVFQIFFSIALKANYFGDGKTRACLP